MRDNDDRFSIQGGFAKSQGPIQSWTRIACIVREKAKEKCQLNGNKRTQGGKLFFVHGIWDYP